MFLVIGMLSSLKSKNSTLDYLGAGRKVGPVQCALSAVASLNSGYMFIGMIGYSYHVGLSSIWMLVSLDTRGPLRFLMAL